MPVAPVQTLLNPDDLADIKPLHAAPFPIADAAMIVACILTILAAALLIGWRLKRKSPATVEPLAAPLRVHWGITLKERLNALPRSAPTSLEDWRKIYFELSAIYRELLERTLRRPITERTAQEILELIKGVLPIDEEQQIRSFFSRTEALLFAKIPCAPSEYEPDVRFARSLFDRALKMEREEEERVATPNAEHAKSINAAKGN